MTTPDEARRLDALADERLARRCAADPAYERVFYDRLAYIWGLDEDDDEDDDDD